MRGIQISTALIASSLLFLSASSLEVTFPTSSDYWVACGWNVLRWTSVASDPNIFSVSLQSKNKTVINDDELVANSLPTAQGQAEVFVPCIVPTADTVLHLVNASHYDHENGTLATSSTFSIKANGTAPSPNSHQTKISTQPDPNFAHATPNGSIVSPPSSSSSNATTTTPSSAKAPAAQPSAANPSNGQQTPIVPPKSGQGSAAPSRYTVEEGVWKVVAVVVGAAYAGVWCLL